MQAINYPATPASPITERVDRYPEMLPEPPRNHRSLRRAVTIAGAALSLGLAGFLIGDLLVGRPDAGGLPDAGLGGFAEMFLSTVLTQAGEGAEDVLAPYLGYSPDLTGFEPGTWYVTQTAVWSVDAAGPDAWTVLVGATQLGLQEGGYAPAGTFFYEIQVEQTPDGLRATALPALVATPTSTAQSAPGTPDIDERLADAVAGFLTNQFTNPETSLFDPVPLNTVMVLTITTGEAAGDHLEVGVDFLGIDAAGRATPLAYRLDVSTVDWSIVEAEDVNQGSS